MNDFQERESRNGNKGYFFNFGLKQVRPQNSPSRQLQHQQLKAKHKTQGQQYFTKLEEVSCQTNGIENEQEIPFNHQKHETETSLNTTARMTVAQEIKSSKTYILKQPSSLRTKFSSPSLTSKFPSSNSTQIDLPIRVPKKMVYYQNKQQANIQNLSASFAYSDKSQNEISKNALHSLKATKINLLSDAFNEFFSTAPSKLYSTQENTAKQTPQSMTKIISVHIDQFPRKNTSLSPKSHKELLHSPSKKYHPFVLNEYHRPSLDNNEEAHIQVQPMNSSRSLNIQQSPSKQLPQTRLGYPELILQYQKCHPVDNIYQKPRISCESASIPMNIVFPYNMNADVSFPLEQQSQYPQEGEQQLSFSRLVQSQLQHPQGIRKHIIKNQFNRDHQPIFYKKQNQQDIRQNSQKDLFPFSNTMILTQLNENTDQGQSSPQTGLKYGNQLAKITKNEQCMTFEEGCKCESNNQFKEDYIYNQDQNISNTMNSKEIYQSKQLPKLGSKIKELTEEAAEILRQEESQRENPLRKQEEKEETGLIYRIKDTQDRIVKGSQNENYSEHFRNEDDCSNRKIEDTDNKDLSSGKSCSVQTITMVVNNKKKKKEARVVFKLSSSHKRSPSSSPSARSPLKIQNPEIPCEISNHMESSSHLPFESTLKPVYQPPKQTPRGQLNSPSKQQPQQQPPQQPHEQLQHQNRFEKLVKNQRAIFTKTFSAATQDETPPRYREQNYYKQQNEYQWHPRRCSQGVEDKKIQMKQQSRYKPAGYFEISPARTVEYQQELV